MCVNDFPDRQQLSKVRRELASYLCLGNPSWKSGLALSEGRSYLAFGHKDGKIEVWDCRNHFRIAELSGHDGEVLALAFLDEGKVLLSGGNDATVKRWNCSGPDPDL